MLLKIKERRRRSRRKNGGVEGRRRQDWFWGLVDNKEKSTINPG
jgi:hypothetical protein